MNAANVTDNRKMATTKTRSNKRNPSTNKKRCDANVIARDLNGINHASHPTMNSISIMTLLMGENALSCDITNHAFHYDFDY